jgi:NADH dehydrogenase (ubiquinone) 1 alpha subcomplex subunit 13
MNMRRLRDNETDLMKDVKGWEVGTYWGEAIYKTLPKEKWMDVSLQEYFTHNSSWDLKWAYNFYKWF